MALPLPSVAVTRTTKLPGAAYGWLAAVPVAVAPSPKLQATVTGPHRSLAAALMESAAPAVPVVGTVAVSAGALTSSTCARIWWAAEFPAVGRKP